MIKMMKAIPNMPIQQVLLKLLNQEVVVG